jgi:hypothetical protein
VTLCPKIIPELSELSMLLQGSSIFQLIIKNNAIHGSKVDIVWQSKPWFPCISRSSGR